jgi:hypothetical protein
MELRNVNSIICISKPKARGSHVLSRKVLPGVGVPPDLIGVFVAPKRLKEALVRI